MTDENRIPIDTDALWPEDSDEDEGVVTNWFVDEGDTVTEGDTVAEIQIEKVTVDVPAPASGTLAERVSGKNDEFERGDTLAYVEPESG